MIAENVANSIGEITKQILTLPSDILLSLSQEKHIARFLTQHACVAGGWLKDAKIRTLTIGVGPRDFSAYKQAHNIMVTSDDQVCMRTLDNLWMMAREEEEITFVIFEARAFFPSSDGALAPMVDRALLMGLELCPHEASLAYLTHNLIDLHCSFISEPLISHHHASRLACREVNGFRQVTVKHWNIGVAEKLVFKLPQELMHLIESS